MDCCIVVIARDEAVRIGECIARIEDDAADLSARLVVLLNGTTDGSRRLVSDRLRASKLPSYLFEIAAGDKSNAWNQYVHAIAPTLGPVGVHIFVDGYAWVKRGAFRALMDALVSDPYAHAASGMPTGSPSASRVRDQMQQSGGLHGSLHALRAEFLDRVRARGLRLPVGLYRGDGLIGSFAMQDLDPLGSPWDTRRIRHVPLATWAAPVFSLRLGLRYIRRRINQARGRIETVALQDVIYKHGFEALPRFADLMLADYLQANPSKRPGWMDLAGQLALRRIQSPQLPSEEQLEACLVETHNVASTALVQDR